jgi:hypothetical protein
VVRDFELPNRFASSQAVGAELVLDAFETGVAEEFFGLASSHSTLCPFLTGLGLVVVVVVVVVILLGLAGAETVGAPGIILALEAIFAGDFLRQAKRDTAVFAFAGGLWVVLDRRLGLPGLLSLFASS